MPRRPRAPRRRFRRQFRRHFVNDFVDDPYARWLEVARADRADALKVILENEQLLAKHGGETPKELRGFCDLPTMLRLLRDQARDNDSIAREIIADPSSANSRRRMENALATVAGRRV